MKTIKFSKEVGDRVNLDKRFLANPMLNTDLEIVFIDDNYFFTLKTNSGMIIPNVKAIALKPIGQH